MSEEELAYEDLLEENSKLEERCSRLFEENVSLNATLEDVTEQYNDICHVKDPEGEVHEVKKEYRKLYNRLLDACNENGMLRKLVREFEEGEQRSKTLKKLKKQVVDEQILSARFKKKIIDLELDLEKLGEGEVLKLEGFDDFQHWRLSEMAFDLTRALRDKGERARMDIQEVDRAPAIGASLFSVRLNVAGVMIDVGADLIAMEAGERFPEHTHPGDHLLIGIHGVFHTTYHGDPYRVTPLDACVVPGDERHAVRAITDCVFLAIGWPAHKKLSDPGRMTILEVAE